MLPFASPSSAITNLAQVWGSQNVETPTERPDKLQKSDLQSDRDPLADHGMPTPTWAHSPLPAFVSFDLELRGKMLTVGLGNSST